MYNNNFLAKHVKTLIFLFKRNYTDQLIEDKQVTPKAGQTYNTQKLKFIPYFLVSLNITDI